MPNILLSKISRNIALASAIFMFVFSIMLITNYVQVKNGQSLQVEVLENLKKLSDNDAANTELHEQIRQLDLMARKAYFISQSHLETGLYILLFVAIVFTVSLRIYYKDVKTLPEKEINPIDDWMLKTLTRKYIRWAALVLTLVLLVFGGFNYWNLRPVSISSKENLTAENDEAVDECAAENLIVDLEQEATVENTTDSIEISKVTHNGFRGNNSLGASSAKNIPTSWNLSSGKNILWKVKTPRKGFNSPVINGNKVFFSGADENARELFCYELSTGKQLWKLEAKNIPGSRIPETTDDTGLAASTVATNGKQVCAIFATGDIICADMDGKQLWAKNIGIPDNSYGYASSLLIFGNSLIIQYDNLNAKKIIALDVATGNQRWAKDRAERHPSWSSPILATVNNKPQLILVGNPGITSYNPNNGEQNWRVEAMSGEPAPSPAYANGIVFAATEYATMVAINAADGSILWKNDEFLPEIASPAATKDFVLVATSYGVVATFHSQTGEMINSMEFNTDFHASPIIADGKIYLICTNGKVFILSAKGDFSLINSFETGEKTFATPAFTDKKVVIRTENSVYCVSTE